jgi:hypothetical protein
MKNELEPIVGGWYRHTDKGQMFRVVAVDEDAETIEIQHFDGDVEEIDFYAWPDLELEPAEEPEDWTGPVDVAETDDLGYTETEMSEEDWRAPLAENRRKPSTWKEDEDEDEDEDEEEEDDDEDDDRGRFGEEGGDEY